MSSRDAILRSVRRQLPQAVERPELTGDWITYPDREKQLGESLAFVGGQLFVAKTVAEADAILREFPLWKAARKTFTAIHGVGTSTFDMDAVDDPHLLEDVDFAVLRGEFAVAENAAVWTLGSRVKHRAIYFIPQHLVLVVQRSEVVDQMHAAYERISFEGRGFGAFISGPSKTADIEQSLVIGAHGARSMCLFLIEESF